MDRKQYNSVNPGFCMAEEESFRDLKKQVDSIVGFDAKRHYLEEYVRENKNIPLPLLAQIHEKLGELHTGEGRDRPWYFKKAASIWELDAVLREVEGEKYEKHFRRVAFKNALRNYSKAFKIFKKNKSWTEMTEIRNRKDAIDKQLRSMPSPFKNFSIIGVGIVFLFSFIFLSSWPTGLVVLDPNDYGQTTGIGMLLVISGIFGGLLILWKWYR